MKTKVTTAFFLSAILLSACMAHGQQNNQEQSPWAKNKDFIMFKNNTSAILLQLQKDVNALETKNYFHLKNAKGVNRVTLDGVGEGGLLKLYDRTGLCIRINADSSLSTLSIKGIIKVMKDNSSDEIIYIGRSKGEHGMIKLYNGDKKEMVSLHAIENQGKLDLQGISAKDYSEVFDLLDRSGVITGTVMSMDKTGKGLTPSGTAYDKKVVGVISGAGGLQSGMTIGSRSDGTNDLPVAVSGQVYVRVCMENGPIEVGDLLVSSNLPGVAMKADRSGNTLGTVIGKAIEPYRDDTVKEGLVRMLVMSR